MTTLATFNGQGQEVAQFAAPVVDFQTRAVQRLAEWAQAADTAYTVASRLVETPFCPQQFRGKPYDATAAILAGSEVGLSPMAALRSFDVIQGTAAPRAITLRAIVQSYGHEIELVTSTKTMCRMRGRRKGAQTWQEVTWTIERAQDLRLTGKDNWKNQPAAMLVARATSEIARLIASDAILGIGYSAEEIGDGDRPDGTPADGAEQVEQVEQEKPRTRTLSRAKAKTEETAPAPATRADLNRLDRAMTNGGVNEKDARLALAREVIGREIASATEMTAAEVDAVIDRLTQPAEQQLPVEEPPAEYDPTADPNWGKGGESR